MWKCVCPANHPDRSACLKRSAHVFETLAAALEHCRCGTASYHVMAAPAAPALTFLAPLTPCSAPPLLPCAAPATPAAHPQQQKTDALRCTQKPTITTPAAATSSLPPLPLSRPLPCRPGDTIWLAPGVTHTVRELQLRCTVHLLGGGAKPEDTVIVAAPGAESALDVR